MSRKVCKVVFVVLVYKNTVDLENFFEMLPGAVKDAGVVVVNSYYDEDTRARFEKIAGSHNADFINTENLGYGHGNNTGIAYAQEQYEYDFLIVSNADVAIKKFTIENLRSDVTALYAPIIKNRSGKYQNPYWPVRNVFGEWLVYMGYRLNSRILLVMGFAIGRALREAWLILFRFSSKRQKRVFAAHGSFVVFTRALIEKMKQPYDEAIFLFSEEADLAYVLRKSRVPSIMTKDIEILHYEDGSMDVSSVSQNAEMKKSVLYYYRKAHRK